jgi:hypothetical protein
VLLGAAMVCVASANAGGFRDTARVVGVRAIVERGYESARVETCEPSQGPPPLLPLAPSLGQDIRGQQQLPAPSTRCRWVDERVPVDRVVGYWVTYEYAGRRHTRRMAHPPGEHLPVRIALEPVP